MAIKRTAKWTLWIGAALLGVPAAFLLLILWLATLGPVSLSVFAPRLESMVNAELKEFQLRFSDTTLDWSRDSRQVTLALVDAQVVDSTGAVIARAPKVAIALSVRALLSGRAVPRSITLERPSARLTRRASGQFELGFVTQGAASGAQAQAGETPAQSQLFDTVLEILRHPEKGGDMSRSLERFAVTGASIDVIDEVTRTRWIAPNAKLQLTRTALGVEATMDAGLTLPGDKVWLFHAHADLPTDGVGIDVKARFDTVTPSDLAKASTALAGLDAFRFPVKGQSHFILGPGGKPGPIQVWLEAGAGEIAPAAWNGQNAKIGGAKAALSFDPVQMRGQVSRILLEGTGSEADLRGSFAITVSGDGSQGLDLNLVATGVRMNLPAAFDAPLVLDQARFKGRIDASRIRVDEAGLRRNNFAISVAGAVTPSAVSPAIHLNGAFTGLTVGDLKGVWPKDLSPNARAWVTAHMTSGQMPKGEIALAIPADAITGQGHPIPDEALTITFDYHSLNADYLEGLPPIVNARGRVILRGDTFESLAEEGIVGPLVLRNGRIFIPTLHLTGTVAAISGEVSASMKDLMTVLDAPRLGYPKRFGLKPEGFKGSANVAFTFNVPTLRDLKAEDVGIRVIGKTEGLAVVLSETIALAGANLQAEITGEGLTATGDALVNMVPMKLSWMENFKPGDRPSTTIEAEALMDDGMRAKLGIDMRPYVTGPVRMRAGFSGAGANIRTGTIMLEFDRARVSAPELNWAMGPGNRITATAKVSTRPKGVIVLDELRAFGGDVALAGRLVLGNGAIREAAFERVKLGPLNDFSVVATMPEIGEQRYVVNGRSIDASQMVANLGAPTTADPRTLLKRPYNIAATVAQVTLKADAVLKDATFRHRTDGIRMRALDLSASYPGGGSLRADLLVTPDGHRKLRIASNDAGRLVRAITGFRSILGGRLMILADMGKLPPLHDAVGMAQDPPPRYSGQVTVEDFKVVNQPFLARLFSAGSFTGLGDLLSGQGIGFTKLEGGFEGIGEQVRIVDGRASGTSLGVTFQGKIDRKADDVSFDGTLVPLYGLNSLFEDIPLVGDILTSRKGEGIIGITYEVAGRSDELDIMVNPLSALTPGIFRRIFQAGKYPDDARRTNPNAPPRPSLRDYERTPGTP